MKNLNITGYGDDLTINGIRIGDLSPQEHENIEKERGGQNYKPLENVVVSHVKDSSTLICRKPSNKNVEKFNWQKKHKENLTGTKDAFKPEGSLSSESRKSHKKYETWK